MAETKPSDKDARVAPHDDHRAASGPQPQPGGASAGNPPAPQAGAAPSAPPPPGDATPGEMVPSPYRKNAASPYTWVVFPVGILLLFILFLFIARPKFKGKLPGVPSPSPSVEEGTNLSNYSAFVEKSKALREDKHTESVLTDEPYSGKAPRVTRAGGPLLSAEIDPQLAAFADALKVRLQYLQFNPVVSRGRAVLRTTRGDFRGFRVSVAETLNNGLVVSEEITVVTPLNGLLKTINHVLEDLQRTDFSGIGSEVRNAGLEFVVLPDLPDKKNIRVLLRVVRPWGKPVPAGLLISGKSVGGIALGMPVALLKSKLDPAFGMLKRKVLVNDLYYDVYKITGRNGEPLIYVYDKGGLVWGISIVSDLFRTERGIGIGSTLDEIRLSYSSVILAVSSRRPHFVKVAGADGIFILSAEGEKKVVSILLGQSPEFE